MFPVFFSKTAAHANYAFLPASPCWYFGMFILTGRESKQTLHEFIHDARLFNIARTTDDKDRQREIRRRRMSLFLF